VSKKLLGGKLQTGFVGFSYNLDAEESPPNSKKLSWMPTCSTPEDFSPDFRQHLLDRGVRTTKPDNSDLTVSGAGSAFMSTLPLGISGRL